MGLLFTLTVLTTSFFARALAADPRETYGSLLYAPSNVNSDSWREKQAELVCVMAVAGLELKRMDPKRDRNALVNPNVPANLVKLLETSWRVSVIDMSQRPPGGRRKFRWPKWEEAWTGPLPAWALEQDAKKQELRDPEMLGRKNFAWNLTRPGGKLYERVMFFDADMLFVDSPAARRGLRDLWALPRGRLWGFESGKVKTCFSGGFLLLEPSRRDFALMQKCLWDPGVLPRLAVCPGHDQRILNSVFAGRWASIDETGAWKKSGSTATSDQNVIHFHHKQASPYVSATWARLMKDVPANVREECAGVY